MTRPNSKGAGIASADAPETHENGQRNFASDEGIGKAFATMRAQLELVGYCLTRAYAEDGSVRLFRRPLGTLPRACERRGRAHVR